jgi:hypothetical protein
MIKVCQLRRTSHEWAAHRTRFSCTFSYKTSQLHLKSHASSAHKKSSRTANLIFHRGHFSVVTSEPTLSIFHSARLRPTICSPLHSIARSSSSMGKRLETSYKWRKVRWGKPAIPSTYGGSQLSEIPIRRKGKKLTKGKILAPPQLNAR